MCRSFLIFSALAISMAHADKTTPRDYRTYEVAPSLARAAYQAYPNVVRMLTNPNDPQERTSIIMVRRNAVDTLVQTSCRMARHCGGFIDITNESKGAYGFVHMRPYDKKRGFTPQLPQIQKRDDIAQALTQVKPQNIESFSKAFSKAFAMRHAESQEGKKAAEWLAQTWRNMAAQTGRSDITVDFIPISNDYPQPNVRVTIPGEDPTAPLVILGGHLDSISSRGDTAPGADDNASGIGAITETFRVMLANQLKPRATIQLFGYAAEELGLVGSRAAAELYKSKNVKVRAVLQMDMVAWPGKGKAVTFITDNVDKDLTIWSEQLYGVYMTEPTRRDRCGYGCSDHASWNRYGYAAVLPFEATLSDSNSRIHSDRDIWDQYLDADHAARFTRLAYAFAVTLATQ